MSSRPSKALLKADKIRNRKENAEDFTINIENEAPIYYYGLMTKTLNKPNKDIEEPRTCTVICKIRECG